MRSFLPPRGYRPLAGISCNVMTYDEQKALARYRPLAGISCNYDIEEFRKIFDVIVPLRG